MQFSSGVCRAGSKAGSLKYKLKASTNHPYCPTLRTLVPDTVVPEGVNCVYEIVMNGLTLDAVKNGMKVGVTAPSACQAWSKSLQATMVESWVPSKLTSETPSVHLFQKSLPGS